MMNKDAARFFHSALYEKNQNSELALEYLSQKRRLSNATIKHFGLGFAPNNSFLFMDYMKSKGYTDDDLVIGFLAVLLLVRACQ